MAKVLLLNSGGLDSALLGKALSQRYGHEVHSLYIATDLINNAQTEAAAATTAANYCTSHRVVPLRFGRIPNVWECKTPRAQMDAAAQAFYPTDPPVVHYDQVADPAAAYAARPFNEFRTFVDVNIVTAATGVAYARTIDCWEVYAGHRITLDDAYVETYNNLSEASRLRVTRPQLRFPLARYSTYREAIEQGLGVTLTPALADSLRAELAYTYSCRWPTPCGVCEKCQGRADIGL